MLRDHKLGYVRRSEVKRGVRGGGGGGAGGSQSRGGANGLGAQGRSKDGKHTSPWAQVLIGLVNKDLLSTYYVPSPALGGVVPGLLEPRACRGTPRRQAFRACEVRHWGADEVTQPGPP